MGIKYKLKLKDLKLEYFKDAPYHTPIRKLDEAKANRELDVKWNGDNK